VKKYQKTVGRGGFFDLITLYKKFVISGQ